MSNIIRLFAKFITILALVHADTYSVKIGTELHVNLVDAKFLSFTIDPEYLFSSSGKYNKKECICMAASLTPAYIRIAGPSTSLTTFHNATISIDALELSDDEASLQKTTMNEYQQEKTTMNQYQQEIRKANRLSVTHEKWETFVRWAKQTGFDLVFALNNDEKTASGMWDPNTALNILTVADKANIGDIFWQLGYECNNQSIEEYLNDLETLRVIIETFPPGRAGQWHVVGGDVTPCLKADSKSDFKDYVALSNEMFDAVFLNGNSSSQELERLSDKERLKLLKTLSKSTTPLWLTEVQQRTSELERAADWMTSLGYSARNGFAVHFRELAEKELYEPTLSFYMALLFKNLVGDRVLSVDIEASQATMFAHCTSLRHKPIPGAVTLFGANMDDEPARFSVKLSKKEDGGDIMQFILAYDHSGNIVVNGRAMYHEGDIKPVVKRVRPYKTLLLNLPARSFGFWVLANTQVDACYDYDDNDAKENQIVEAPTVESNNEAVFTMKSKRSVRYDVGGTKESPVDFVELMNETDLPLEVTIESKALNDRMNNLSEELLDIKHLFSNKYKNSVNEIRNNKVKRQVLNRETGSERRRKPKKGSRLRNHKQKNSNDYHGSNLISKLLQVAGRNRTRGFRKGSEKKLIRGAKRIGNRNVKTKDKIIKRDRVLDSQEISTSRRKSEIKPATEVRVDPDCNSLRKRRSIDEDRVEVSNNKDYRHEKKIRKIKSTKDEYMDSLEDEVSGNDIDGDKGIFPVGKIWNKLKKFGGLPIEIAEKDDTDLDDNESDMDEIILKTKLLDDSAIINISEKSKHGFIKSTLEDFLSVLADLNRNLNKIWSALTIFQS